MSGKVHEVGDESRREFLKKAGKVAWIVPTIQVVNMAAAAAGDVNGSVVTTTSTSTTTTTTTEAPECTEYRICRIKAELEGGWSWDRGVGANDCIQQGDWDRCLGSEIGASVSGDDSQATVTVPGDCEIIQAAHKEANNCVPASITNRGRTATFTKGEHGISHVELVVKCCVDDVE